MSRARPKVLVVTGPTGAGKSSLCAWLAERGAWWIDADTVGHEMLRRSEIRDALVKRLGEEILGEDGEVDRPSLGRLVFSETAALGALNRIVHPALVAEVERRVELLTAGRGVELIVVDAALHFQFDPRIACDLVVGVDAETSLRSARIQRRDSVDEEAARLRMDRQIEVEASLSRADAVLDSSATPEELRAEFFELVDRRLGTDFTSKQTRMTPRRPTQSPTAGSGEEE
jgi:dephospho-CoA kinase